ncbi:MAG: bifunctional ornithine acetyltransferase/N-acetylglutamate synthase, partial [Actinobacteria bacterium]|nr:bifunctional ornithine acetyltransferase/N-acetylglutamate synthase [Actinomycetota bacterium]
PNWGRVLAAAGTADAAMDPQTIDVTLNGVKVCKDSAPFGDKNTVDFTNRLVVIEIDMKVGLSSATILTNDLSHDYVHENSAYST